MNPKDFNNKLAKNMVIIGMSIFGFGLGANIISVFYVESFNDYIMTDGIRFGLLSLFGGAIAYIGTLVEKKSNEKSV